MCSVLFTALVLYCMTASTFQTSRCQHLREKCSTIPKCESIWKPIERFCNKKGNNCAIQKSENCHTAIKFLVPELPKFKDCNCTKDVCDIQMLLDKECSDNQGQPAPSSGPDIQIRFPQPTKLKEIAQTGLLEKNCIIAEETCQKDNACFLLYRHFQKMCRAEESTYNCQTEGLQCFKLFQELKKTILGDCKCSEPRCEKCMAIWKNIFNNSCLQQTPEYQASSLNKNTYANKRPQSFDTDLRNTEAQWKLSTLSNAEYKPQHSCLHVQAECVSDTICNRQFAKYFGNCQASEMPCHVDRCKTALRNFYQNMPFNIAQKLTFCDCEELDGKCLHSKETLHGKLCTDLVQAPSCHSMFQTCQGNSLCQEKYNAFASKCLKDISQACLENDACIEYLDTKDFNCSDSAGCRRAYIDLWGILRPVDCTCDMRSPAEQSSCKLFHHILQSHSCFSQIAGRRAEHYPLLTDLSETKSSTTHKESLFVGDAVYIAIYSCCTILILGVVLLAFLKTRAFVKQAKTPSPAHLSERLMIPQQPWIINCMDNDLPCSSHSQPLSRLP